MLELTRFTRADGGAFEVEVLQLVECDADGRSVAAITLDPGTLQSKARRTTAKLSFNNPPQKAGCHAVTVVTSHLFRTVPPRPVDDTDVDTATWFYYVGLKPTDPEFEDCDAVSRPGDAGADARDGGS